MEKKLYNYIMMPAMIFSWLFGLLLIHSIGFSVFSELWMQIKTAAVVILTYYHFSLGNILTNLLMTITKKPQNFLESIMKYQR